MLLRIIRLIMENHMEKRKMDNEMDAGSICGSTGWILQVLHDPQYLALSDS